MEKETEAEMPLEAEAVTMAVSAASPRLSPLTENLSGESRGSAAGPWARTLASAESRSGKTWVWKEAASRPVRRKFAPSSRTEPTARRQDWTSKGEAFF